MFNNQRYVTKGIIAEIPGYLQNLMWFMVESLKLEKDYLQVFELISETVDGIPMQKLIHSQEQPPYKKEISIEDSAPITNKIYIIDDKTHSTMLLATEY